MQCNIIWIFIFLTCITAKTNIISARNSKEKYAYLMYVRYILLIWFYFQPWKTEKTQNILAQNTIENNADFDYIRYVFLILILIISKREIAESHFILAQNFEENYIDSRYIRYEHQFFDFKIFNMELSLNPVYFSSKFWRN
jgi:hypothetical protein